LADRHLSKSQAARTTPDPTGGLLGEAESPAVAQQRIDHRVIQLQIKPVMAAGVSSSLGVAGRLIDDPQGQETSVHRPQSLPAGGAPVDTLTRSRCE